MFLSNVPKEIRSTEMAEIPSELGAEQGAEHSRVGRAKSCSILTGAEGRAGLSSLLAPSPQPCLIWGYFSDAHSYGCKWDVGRTGVATFLLAWVGETQAPSQTAQGVFKLHLNAPPWSRVSVPKFTDGKRGAVI